MYKTILVFCSNLVLLSLIGLTGIGKAVGYESTTEDAKCKVDRQFTFSWQVVDGCKNMQPRGGTTKGTEITRDPNPNKGWLSLQEEGLSKFEKDRRGILAMAGAYRVSFDFLETVGFTPDYSPSRPYQSWGTEYVYVVEDTGEFISLQHIMVMYFQQEDGKPSTPMVMKHWRQDWQYEKKTHFVYTGFHRWHRSTQKTTAVQGTWSQSVYQVDDSPRYESFGKWQHHANFSSWKSGNTWRPLPRREGSVRDDYQVLQGTNSHTILPSGWVQEEENLKLVLNQDGTPHESVPYLAKELGLARYERIVDHDFTPGDEYWEKSKTFWADVRHVWKELIKDNESIVIHKKVNEQFMFMPFFAKAQSVVDGEEYDSIEGRKEIRRLLEPFIELQ